MRTLHRERAIFAYCFSRIISGDIQSSILNIGRKKPASFEPRGKKFLILWSVSCFGRPFRRAHVNHTLKLREYPYGCHFVLIPGALITPSPLGLWIRPTHQGICFPLDVCPPAYASLIFLVGPFLRPLDGPSFHALLALLMLFFLGEIDRAESCHTSLYTHEYAWVFFSLRKMMNVGKEGEIFSRTRKEVRLPLTSNRL